MSKLIIVESFTFKNTLLLTPGILLITSYAKNLKSCTKCKERSEAQPYSKNSSALVANGVKDQVVCGIDQPFVMHLTHTRGQFNIDHWLCNVLEESMMVAQTRKKCYQLPCNLSGGIQGYSKTMIRTTVPSYKATC
jgi:hypothetical protein